MRVECDYTYEGDTMFHIHRWSKWSEPQDATATATFRGRISQYAVDAQARTCEKCGKQEIRVC